MKKLLSFSAVLAIVLFAFVVFGGQNDRFSPIELTDIIGASDASGVLTKGNVVLSSATWAKSATWTLSASEAQKPLLIVTSGVSTQTILTPTVSDGKVYVVRNATAVTLTIKKSGGTGISIASGKTAIVIYNSTYADYYRLTADQTH